MRPDDQLRFNWQVFRRHPVRTGLMLLAVSIGVTSVILLTSLGEGARLFVENEFSSLGNRLLIVFPGRNETTGHGPPIFGTSPRDLTIDDALAFRRLPSVTKVAPVIAGTVSIARENRSRDVITMGTTPDFLEIRQLTVNKGNNLPETSDSLSSPVAILGAKVKRELFSNQHAVGEWVRIGDRRMRIGGIIEDAGQSIGLDMEDLVLIPIRTAEQLYNSPAVFRVMVELSATADDEKVKERMRDIIRDRHEGEDDITLVSQDSVLKAFDNILTSLTLAIGSIGAIGLFVAGILIMNISLISVSQRRQEIGLLKALGASSKQVRNLFLGDALMLVSFGSAVGIILAFSLVFFFRRVWSSFPMTPPLWAVPAVVVMALFSGLLFAWLPARRAAALDPVLALRGHQG